MEGAPRTPSGSPAAGGPFFCQSCANRQIVVGSRQPEHCAGQYLVSTISQMEIPFQACCVCAASAGWTGWANDACDQCKASKARSKTFIQERVRGSDTICHLQPAQETAVVERQTEEMRTTQRAADVLMQSKSRRKSPATLGKLLPISHDRSSPFPNSDSLDTATNQQKLRYRPPSKHSAQGWIGMGHYQQAVGETGRGRRHKGEAHSGKSLQGLAGSRNGGRAPGKAIGNHQGENNVWDGG